MHVVNEGKNGRARYRKRSCSRDEVAARSPGKKSIGRNTWSQQDAGHLVVVLVVVVVLFVCVLCACRQNNKIDKDTCDNPES